MTNINYNEFQAGQGVSAPSLNENFTLTNAAIVSLTTTVNSAITSLTTTTNLKANKNGSSAELFNVATAQETTQAVNLGQLNEALAPKSPTGCVIWYAGSSAPTGYLLCDGSAVSRTTYSALFAIIGVKFGVGDSSTTFNIPNLINRFIEGSSAAGTYISAGLPNIKGKIGTPSDWLGGNSGCIYTISNGRYVDSDGNAQYANYVGINASLSSSIYGNSSTVQPPALTLLPCIKY